MTCSILIDRKKLVSLNEKLEPLVSEVREISLQIGDINQELFSLTLEREKYNDSKITEKFSKILRKRNLSKYLESLDRNNNELIHFL